MIFIALSQWLVLLDAQGSGRLMVSNFVRWITIEYLVMIFHQSKLHISQLSLDKTMYELIIGFYIELEYEKENCLLN